MTYPGSSTFPGASTYPGANLTLPDPGPAAGARAWASGPDTLVVNTARPDPGPAAGTRASAGAGELAGQSRPDTGDASSRAWSGGSDSLYRGSPVLAPDPGPHGPVRAWPGGPDSVFLGVPIAPSTGPSAATRTYPSSDSLTIGVSTPVLAPDPVAGAARAYPSVDGLAVDRPVVDPGPAAAARGGSAAGLDTVGQARPDQQSAGARALPGSTDTLVRGVTLTDTAPAAARSWPGGADAAAVDTPRPDPGAAAGTRAWSSAAVELAAALPSSGPGAGARAWPGGPDRLYADVYLQDRTDAEARAGGVPGSGQVLYPGGSTYPGGGTYPGRDVALVERVGVTLPYDPTPAGARAGAGATEKLRGASHLPLISFPILHVAVDFTAGAPSAPGAAASDVTADLVLPTVKIKRGRQYELGSFEAGTCSLSFNDPAEYLNPANPASPYNQEGRTIQPYRPVQVTAVWQGVAYTPFTGFVERYPRTWPDVGFNGKAPLEAVDALGMFARSRVAQSYYAAVMADAPTAWAPLNAVPPAGPTGYAGDDTTARNLPGLTVRQGNDQGAVNWAGDTTPDGTPALQLQQNWQKWEIEDDEQRVLTYPYRQWVALDAGFGSRQMPWTLDSTRGFTVEGWARWSSGVVGFLGMQNCGPYLYDAQVPLGNVVFADARVSSFIGFTVEGGVLLLLAGRANSGGSYQQYGVPEGGRYPDDQWHYFAYSVYPNPSNPSSFYSVAVTVDGATFTYDTNLSHFTLRPNSAMHAHVQTADTVENGQLSVGLGAVYTTGTLSGARRYAHYRRGVGNLGEASGARVARLLDELWPGGARTVAPGEATLDADFSYGLDVVPGAENTRAGNEDTVYSLAEVLQDIESTEIGGALYATGAGRVVFEDRASRVTRARSYTFGDRPELGELPYVDLAYDLDPTKMYSQVEFSRDDDADSSTYVATSPAAYQVGGFLDYSVQLDVADDWQIRQAGIGFLARYGQARIRITRLKLDPAAHPALFPVVLSLEPGVRVRVIRRTSVFTMDGDFFVESVEHDIDAASGKWDVSLELSPVMTPSPLLAGQALAAGTVVY